MKTRTNVVLPLGSFTTGIDNWSFTADENLSYAIKTSAYGLACAHDIVGNGMHASIGPGR